MADLPVAIVGAGVVGLSAALSLQALGIPTVIIGPTDSEQGGVSCWGTRVSAVARTHLEWLSELGLTRPVLEPLICPFQAMQIWHDRSSGWVDFTVGDEELGAIVDNRALLSALAVQCKTNSIGWIAASVEAISFSTSGPRLHISTGEVIDAQLVVGADGVDSTVRRLAKIRRWSTDTGQSAIVANVACDRSHDHVARQIFLQSGPLAYLPITSESGEPNRLSIVWTVDRGRLSELAGLSDKAFSRRVASYVKDDFDELYLASDRKIIALYQSHAEHYVVPGIVLIGDAAHQIHPMAGQGANLGFADVRCLSGWLERASQRSIALNDFCCLKRYESERRPINRSALALMACLQTLYSVEHPVIQSSLGVGMNQFNRLLPIKRRVLQFVGSSVTSD